MPATSMVLRGARPTPAARGVRVRLALAGGVAFDAVALEPPPGAGALPVQLADGRVFGLTPAADGTQYAVYLLPQ